MTLRATLVLGLLPALSGAAERIYVVDAGASAVTIHVGKSGLASFAGHEHEVAARRFQGEVVADPADPTRASLRLEFDAASLEVTGRGEPAKDVPKVQEAMQGPKVLDVARFAAIGFRSRQVAGRETAPGVYELRITGAFSLHGAERELVVPARVELSGDTLVASGELAFKQTAFGIKPVSAGAGMVKVKDELEVVFRFVARAAAQ
jgi:polyisoprenoid-binding protein YceI